MCISAYNLITLFTLLLSFAYHFLFMYLLSTNYKCAQPCYFSLLYKPVIQKVKIDWNYSIRNSRLCVAPVDVPVKL
jgi:hypothetical protein